MKGQSFKNTVAECHETWLAKELGLERSDSGIDLSDEDIAIEVKSWWRRHNTYNFSIPTYQRERFPEDLPNHVFYWALIDYELRVNDSKQVENDDLEPLVTSRTSRILPWNWIDDIPKSQARHEEYYYVKERHIPEEDYFERFETSGGEIYIPKSSRELKTRIEIPF